MCPPKTLVLKVKGIGLISLTEISYMTKLKQKIIIGPIRNLIIS